MTEHLSDILHQEKISPDIYETKDLLTKLRDDIQQKEHNNIIGIDEIKEKLYTILPSYEQVKKSNPEYILTKKEFLELQKIHIGEIEIGLKSIQKVLWDLGGYRPDLIKYIQPNEIVALAWQESLLFSDSAWEHIKGQKNSDQGYVQLSQKNEQEALLKLGTSFDVSIKESDPQQYRTLLGVVWYIDNKSHIQKPNPLWTQNQVDRLCYYIHNAGIGQYILVKKASEELTQGGVLQFTHVEQAMIAYIGSEVLEPFTTRIGKNINPYYVSIVNKIVNTIQDIPVVERPPKEAPKIGNSLQTPYRAAISYNYMRYVDKMKTYLDL